MTNSGDVADFCGLADNMAETITIKSACGGVTASPSNPITVKPGGDRQGIIERSRDDGDDGQAFAVRAIIDAEDQNGNLEAGDNSGEQNRLPSSSAILPEAGGMSRTKTTVASSDNPARFGNIVVFKATVTTGGHGRGASTGQ